MRIGHYMRQMFEPGGIASYIRRISAAQRDAGHEVFYFDRAPVTVESPETVEPTADDAALMRRAAELRLDVLHLHCMVEDVAGGGVPLVRTVHTHAPYCPSQGRFLKSPGAPCDRNYSLLGCGWGHLVNRCGSVRPAAVLRNFATVRAEKRTLRKIQTLVVSDFMKRQMVRAGYPGERIEVLYLPAPAAKEYAPPPIDGRPRFVFLGRMIPHKGVDWLLRAAKLVRTDVAIDLAGTGNQEQEYRALAASLGLGERVTFHGWLAADRVEPLLRRARALVFPSVWHEPGGTVAFEAMVNGRAVIMSRVGGMPEVVQDGVNGLLVEPGDVPGLAAAIDRLAADIDLARRLGEVGRARVAERYTMAMHMGRLAAVYARVLSDDVTV